MTAGHERAKAVSRLLAVTLAAATIDGMTRLEGTAALGIALTGFLIALKREEDLSFDECHAAVFHMLEAAFELLDETKETRHPGNGAEIKPS